MAFFSKAKSSLKDNKITKQKKENRKIPKAKKGNGKGARIFIWIILVVLVLIGPLAFVRAQNALNKSKDSETAIVKMQNNTDENKGSVYSSPSLQIFSESVVNEYIDIPKTEEDREVEKKQLVDHFAEGVALPVIGEFKGYRKLDSKRLYDIQYKEDKAVLSYIVDYTNVIIEEHEEKKKEKVDEKKKTVTEVVEEEIPTKKTIMLNVPVKANKNGGFTVIEPPYFSSVPNIQANNIKAKENPLENEKQVPVSKIEEIEKWLKTFFSDYASKKSDEMSYVMDEPQALAGEKDFVGMNDLSIYPTKKENVYTVKVYVIFKEKEIDISHEEPFTLKIQYEDGKYFVKSMKNTIGGK